MWGTGEKGRGIDDFELTRFDCIYIHKWFNIIKLYNELQWTL